MQPGKRRPPPPWQRARQAPRHPVGNARRRWPRAYDGAGAAQPPERYRRAFDGAAERRVQGGPRLPRRRRSALEKLRRNPVRHGLIGLGIAGAAVPIAVGRQHAANRTNPSHEQTLAAAPGSRISDSAVTRAWRQAAGVAGAAATGAAATAASSATAARESKIQEKLEQYKSYDLSRDLAESIYDLALKRNIDPDVAFGLVRTESAFKNSATSHVGALGLTQLMPSTARWMRPNVTASDLRNPEINLDIGFRYLRDLLDKYKDDTRLALLAYNRGPGTVDRVLERGGNPDNGYVEMVLTGKGL
jgi:hypothetical protein